MREIRTGICRKVQKDHRGMSLVEVIVAITILGIVAVPVLHSLTTAMVYNQKARTRQEMTLTAESIMETFKGYDLPILFERFGGSGDASKKGEGGKGGTGIEGIDFETVDTDSGYRYKSEPFTIPYTAGAKTAKKYTFYIDDMKADNGKLYDVTITAEPNSIEDIMEPTQMEPTRDAVFLGNRDYDTQAHSKAVEDFLTNHKSDLLAEFGANAYADIGGEKQEITAALIESGMSIESYIKLDEKHLTFNIEEKDDNYEVNVGLEFTYHFAEYPYYVKKGHSSVPDEYESMEGSTDGGTPAPKPDEWESKSLTWNNSTNAFAYSVTLPDAQIYKNPVEAKLGRLFIYYYPNYNLKPEPGTDSGVDKIIINNKTNITKFQCYILKQRTDALSNNSLKTKENGYKAYVEIKNPSGGSCEVFHNFKDNIGGGSSTTEPSITGAVGDYSYATPQLTTRFEKQEVLSYKLTLDVKQEGRPITTIVSTMNEKIKKSEE